MTRRRYPNTAIVRVMIYPYMPGVSVQAEARFGAESLQPLVRLFRCPCDGIRAALDDRISGDIVCSLDSNEPSGVVIRHNDCMGIQPLAIRDGQGLAWICRRYDDRGNDGRSEEWIRGIDFVWAKDVESPDIRSDRDVICTP